MVHGAVGDEVQCGGVGYLVDPRPGQHAAIAVVYLLQRRVRPRDIPLLRKRLRHAAGRCQAAAVGRVIADAALALDDGVDDLRDLGFRDHAAVSVCACCSVSWCHAAISIASARPSSFLRVSHAAVSGQRCITAPRLASFSAPIRPWWRFHAGGPTSRYPMPAVASTPLTMPNASPKRNDPPVPHPRMAATCSTTADTCAPGYCRTMARSSIASAAADTSWPAFLR